MFGAGRITFEELMNYLEAKTYLESLAPTLTRPTLERVRRFMDSHPHLSSVPCIHIGGTNGKGSTVAIADSVLRSLGYTVGRFTGPHLLRWNERFHVNGTAISDEAFARLSTELRALSEKFGVENPDIGALTWFEFLTVIAFMHFVECHVDIAVIEVGLGGQFDATNVVTNPLTTVITNVSLDHTHLLGDTVEKIAFEKAGIIKSNVPVVTACQGAALDEVLRNAKEKSAPVFALTESGEIAMFENGTKVRSVSNSSFDSLIRQNLALQGSYQLANGQIALIALAAANRLERLPLSVEETLNPKVTPEILVERIEKADHDLLASGLRNVRWAGRLQYLPGYDLLLDGAHNPAGAKALRDSLEQLYPEKKLLYVLSSFESKDVVRLLEGLVRGGERVFVAEAKGRRSSHSKEFLLNCLRELGAEGESFASIAEAVDAARQRRESNEVVVVSGSFAAVKETMQHLSFSCVEDSYLSDKAQTN